MTDNIATPELVVAKKKDLDLVLHLIKEYHKLEGLELRSSKLMNTVYPLLRKQNEFGCILLIKYKGEAIGYLALCFGYSLEFGGRDAFIDEFFILEAHRGKKIGKAVLSLCLALATELGLKALHLEAKSSKDRLKKIYRDAGFKARDKYQLMTAGVQ